MHKGKTAQAIPTGCDSCQQELDELLAATARSKHADGGLTARFRPVANLEAGGIFGHLASIHCPPERFLNSAARLLRVARRQGRLDEFYRLYFRLVLDQFVLNQGDGCLLLPLGEGPTILGTACSEMLVQALHKSTLSVDQLVTIHAGLDGLEGVAQENAVGVVAAMRGMGVRVAAGTLHCPRSERLLWTAQAPEFVMIEEGVLDVFEPNILQVSRLGELIHQQASAGRRIVATEVDSLALLKVLQGIGVSLVSGHFIGKPVAVPTRTISAAAHKFIAEKVSGHAEQPTQGGHILEKMLQGIPPVAPDVMADEVFSIFERNQDLRAIAVVKQDTPIGLIARYDMIDNMARPYRHELYGRKPCTRFMDEDPLIVEMRLPLSELSEILVRANPRHLISGFIITDGGHYLGIGSVQDLVREVTAMQMEAAKYANPLSQLPGNVPINQHIDNLLAAREPFIIAYCDLDHFKPFNDVYGYARGDDVIRLTARVLAEACDPEKDFIGHIGGDDFVLVLRSEDWHDRCERVLRLFGEEILGFFSRDDIERGGYVTENRKGNMEFHALTSLSIGVVEASPGVFRSHLEISVVAAEVKKKAKGIKGNSLCVNRRVY
ncbi:MAG: diguanylate cyclase [Rhodocyclaceae bacterium]|nr:diguanylate cyclase [Rhodocyclaceae bacterium]MDZ4213266.1 diguanylate cyclase [Rhodocyclaceae bacterium]